MCSAHPFWRHVCIRCSVSAWTLGCIWGRGLIAECLDSMAEKVCSSAFHIKFLAFLFRIQGGELIPVLLPAIIYLLFMVFLRTGKWIEWMNESSGICFTLPNVFSRCFRWKSDEKGIKSDEGVGFWMLCWKVCVELIDIGPQIWSPGRAADAGLLRGMEERGARCWRRCVWSPSGVSEPCDDYSFWMFLGLRSEIDGLLKITWDFFAILCNYI